MSLILKCNCKLNNMASCICAHMRTQKQKHLLPFRPEKTNEKKGELLLDVQLHPYTLKAETDNITVHL